MQKLILLLLAFLSAIAVVAAPVQVDEPAPRAGQAAHRVVFEYHSAFLMNLHHYLFDAAVRNKRGKWVWPIAPNASELKTLQDAVAFYQANYADRDILFDDTMTAIKVALRVEDARRDATGLSLPLPLIAVLNSAAPIYARYLWQDHDKSNQAWILQAKRLDAAYGAEIQLGIERHLAHAFPLTPIRIDLVLDTGSFQGAYTDAQIVLPSGRADYQDLASLEMLYHEASHTVVTDTLEEAIAARLKATHRAGDSPLWHALQFYTVGKVVQDTLQLRGHLDYQPYAEKNGVYQRGFSLFLPLIEHVWQPYMDKKLSLQEAVNKMVDALPAPKN